MVRRVIPIVALLLAMTASAQQKSKSTMISAARQTLVKHFGENGSSFDDLKVAGNIDQLAVVASAEGGTAFVNKRTGVVMGCSPSAYTSEEALPCGLKMWISAANNAIKSNNTGWTRAGDYNITEKVGSFIKTRWNQNAPYNQYCPTDADGKECYTGCVATAMAQVLNYYKYPTQGVGTGSYTIDDGDTYTKVDISGVYDWKKMKTKYMSGYTDNEAKAVATLMRDCGYSVNMKYSPEGSGTYETYIPSAMSYNFCYDSLAVNYVSKDYTSEEKWYSTIYAELAAKRPVIFSGQSESNGGHCFILDGVDTDGTVHVNWGWGGQQDGFYDMDVFDDNYDYVSDQSIVYGFNPQPTAEGVTPQYSSCLIVYKPTLDADGTNLILDAGVYNYDWRVFLGDIYVQVVDTNNPDKTYLLWLQEANGKDVLSAFYGWGFDNEILNGYFVTGNQQTMVFPASTYEISIVYKGIYDDSEKTAVTNGGKEWRQRFAVAADGTIAIEESAGISAVAADKSSAAGSGKVYDLNGNRVGNAYKGLKIAKGRKYVERL